MPDPKKFTPPASPTASYYDLSDNDDDEEEYSTITHTSTGRGVKLLYSKSKVSFTTERETPLIVSREGSREGWS